MLKARPRQSARSGLLHGQEATALLDAHRFLTRLRQTLWLLDDTAADFVPATDADPGLAVALGRALTTDPSELLRRFHDHRRQVRAVYDRVLG